MEGREMEGGIEGESVGRERRDGGGMDVEAGGGDTERRCSTDQHLIKSAATGHVNCMVHLLI
jgi:hypothetical protein